MKETTRRRFLAASVALTGSGTLAGCLGSDDPLEIAIDPGTAIVLGGRATHWEGLEPEALEGAENPTFLLEAGGGYDMTWINADGLIHNLEIHDADGRIVDGLITDDVSAEGEGATLSFTARPEYAAYVCHYHTPQRGDLIVE